MASRTIKGLTVEIGGDTRKLSDAVKSAEKQMSSMRKELTDVNKLLRFDPSNTDALRQKTELLTKAISACGDKLEELDKFERAMAAKESRTEQEEEQYRALQREIMETESKMKDYQKQLNGTYLALGKLGDESEEVAKAVQEMNAKNEVAKSALEEIADSMKEVNTKSSDLNKELTSVNRALKEAPNNVTLLRMKHDILAESVENSAERLKLLEQAEKEVQERFKKGEASVSQVRELRRQIIETSNKMDGYKSEINDVNTAYVKAALYADKAEDAVDEFGDEAQESAKEVDKLGDELDETKSEMSGLSSAADKAGGGFTVFKGAVADLLAEGLRELVECLKEAGKYMLQTGMSFDATMSKVKALLPEYDRTKESMSELTDLAMEMGATTKFSANDSADAMTYLAQAGWDAEKIMKGLPGVMHLASVDGIELASAAEITAQAINALGYEAGDATMFADLLAVTAAETCTDVEEMGYAFQYVGPVAGALGFEMEDLAVAIGAMANAGISGEKAGTSLRSLFTNMAKPTAAMATAMDRYGITLTDASGNMKPLSQIMTELRDVFAGLTEEQKTNLAATIAGKTGMAGLLSIVNQSPKDFDKLVGAIESSGGAAQEMSDIVRDNLAGDVEELGGSFETLSVKITNMFNQPMRDAVQALTDFVNGKTSMTEMLTSLGDAFSQAFGTFQTLLPQLGQMGSEFLNWIINGIVTGLPLLMSKATEMVTSFCSSIAAAAPNLVSVASSLLTSFVQGIFNFIPSLITGAAQIVGSLAQGIQGNAASFVSKALDLLDGFADKLTVALPVLIEKGMNFITNLVKGLMQALPEFIARAPEIISKFANLINDNFPKILAKGVGIIWELIKGIVKAIPTLVKNIPKIITAIVDVWEAFNWLSLGKKCIDLLGKGIKSMWGWIKNIGKQTVDASITFVKQLPENLLNLGAKAFKFFGNGIKSCIASLKTVAQSVWNTIWNTLKGLPSKMLSIGVDLMKGLVKGCLSTITWLWEQISSFGGSIVSAFKSAFGIKSPSRVFRDEIGKNIGLGLAQGIENSEGAVEAAMGGLSDTVMGTSFDGLALERDLQHRGAQIAATVTAQTDSSMLGKLDKILSAIEKGQVISLDGRQLVGGTVAMYDAALGQRRLLAARGAI